MLESYGIAIIFGLVGIIGLNLIFSGNTNKRFKKLTKRYK